MIQVTIVVISVLTIVMSFLIFFVLQKYFVSGCFNKYVYSCEWVEIMWAVVPGLILVAVGCVSLTNLYNIETGPKVDEVINVSGRQWYWHYEYSVDFSRRWLSGSHNASCVDWFNGEVLGVKGVWAFINEGIYESCMEGLMNSVGCGKFLSVGWSVLKEPVDGDSGKFTLSYWFSRSPKLNFNYFLGVPESNGVYNLASDCVLLNNGVCGGVSDITLWDASNVSPFFRGELFRGSAHLIVYESWNLELDSFTSGEDLLETTGSSWRGGLRNLDVSLPCLMVGQRGWNNELLVTSGDVMHSWGVPSLGGKIDAVPGRTNSIPLNIFGAGVFYGGCYELCGAGHSDMSIEVMAINSVTFQAILEVYSLSLSGLRSHIYSVFSECGPCFGKGM